MMKAGNDETLASIGWGKARVIHRKRRLRHQSSAEQITRNRNQSTVQENGLPSPKNVNLGHIRILTIVDGFERKCLPLS
jgi:hypothetical protein